MKVALGQEKRWHPRQKGRPPGCPTFTSLPPRTSPLPFSHLPACTASQNASKSFVNILSAFFSFPKSRRARMPPRKSLCSYLHQLKVYYPSFPLKWVTTCPSAWHLPKLLLIIIICNLFLFTFFPQVSLSSWLSFHSNCDSFPINALMCQYHTETFVPDQ